MAIREVMGKRYWTGGQVQKSPAGKFNHDFLLEISPIGVPDARPSRFRPGIVTP